MVDVAGVVAQVRRVSQRGEGKGRCLPMGPPLSITTPPSTQRRGSTLRPPSCDVNVNALDDTMRLYPLLLSYSAPGALHPRADDIPPPKPAFYHRPARRLRVPDQSRPRAM